MSTLYAQTIYDTGLGAYVRYTLQYVTDSPDPAVTIPTGVGPFDSSTHKVIAQTQDQKPQVWYPVATIGDLPANASVVIGDTCYVVAEDAQYVYNGIAWVVNSGGSGVTANEVATGELTNPTAYAINGVFDIYSSFWTIESSVTGMGMPAGPLPTTRLAYFISGCYVGPNGYPTTGTVNCGATIGAPGTPIPIPAGAYFVVGDGADNWYFILTGPDLTTIISDIATAQSTANNAQTSANNAQTTANNAYNGLSGKQDSLATIAGPVSVNSQRFTSVADPVDAQDGATKNYVDGSTTTIAGASATLGAEAVSRVTYAAGVCALTLPASTTTWPVGATKRIVKENTGSFKITLAPDSGGTVGGLGVNVAVDLPGSTRPASTSYADQWWDVTRDATSKWRIQGGAVRYDTSGNVDLGAGNISTSGTVDGRDVSADGTSLDSLKIGFMPAGYRTTAIDITIDADDAVLLVDTSGGARNITLSAAALARGILVKKKTTDANKITLVRAGSESIEGVAANYDLPGSTFATRLSWWVWSDGTDWWVS